MMPFFRSKSYSNYLTRHSIYKSKKFFAPLQVRTHKYVALLKQKKFSGKRGCDLYCDFGAFSLAYFNPRTREGCDSLQIGSVTICSLINHIAN